MSDRASDMDRVLAWVDSPDGIAVAARLADALEAIDDARDDAIRLCPLPDRWRWVLDESPGEPRLTIVHAPRDTRGCREWVRIRHRQHGGIVAEYTLTEWQNARPSWLVAGRMPAWLRVCRVRRRGPL